jgi:hypothetical protein
MKQFTWRDKVRVTVKELSRTGQLRAWQHIDTNASDTFAVKLARVQEAIAAEAVTAIEVCDNGAWLPVVKALELDGFTLPYPLSASALAELPGSLGNGIVRTAMEENEGIDDFLSLTRLLGATINE